LLARQRKCAVDQQVRHQAAQAWSLKLVEDGVALYEAEAAEQLDAQ